MQENAAQRYTQAIVVPPDLDNVDWQAKPFPFKLYRNCEQIPLSIDGDSAEGQIGQMLRDIYGLTRQDHSIPAFHPMLKFLPREATSVMAFYPSLLRPVPSGGALFPCEMYLLVGPGQHLPVGIYHYDVAHHALDVLEQGDYSPLLQTALAHPGDTPPAYTLLLSCIFWKDGFKYGAFSYRLQGLNIGTVIGQSEIIARHAGLSTTIHHQFQDKVLNDLLGLDPLYESVYTVIEWRSTGVGNVDDVGDAQDPSLRSPTIIPEEQTQIMHVQDKAELVPTSTESIACWPLPEEIHRASLIETREAFRPLHSLAPIKSPRSGGQAQGTVPTASPMFKTLPLEGSQPLDLWEARHKRRSAVGNFLPTPLTRQQLSQLLLTSMSGTTNDLDGHSDFLQHTLLYCVINSVTDIDAGIYVYNPKNHDLEPVRIRSMQYGLHQALAVPHANMFYAGVNLFPVGNYTSGFQVYGDRWYRMQNMEAGIIAQRLYLAAAALSLGCRASLGFSAWDVNKFLGLPDTKDHQYMSLMQIMVAPEQSAYQHYEQSLLI